MTEQYDQVRRYPRIKIEMPVQATFTSEHGAEQNLRAVELGQGGCLLRGSDYFGNGCLISLQLDLPERTMRTVAKILYEFPDRSGRICSGVQFLSLEEPDFHHLGEFISDRLPELPDGPRI